MSKIIATLTQLVREADDAANLDGIRNYDMHIAAVERAHEALWNYFASEECSFEDTVLELQAATKDMERA